jgi:hypothetical protein
MQGRVSGEARGTLEYRECPRGSVYKAHTMVENHLTRAPDRSVSAESVILQDTRLSPIHNFLLSFMSNEKRDGIMRRFGLSRADEDREFREEGHSGGATSAHSRPILRWCPPHSRLGETEP